MRHAVGTAFGVEKVGRARRSSAAAVFWGCAAGKKNHGPCDALAVRAARSRAPDACDDMHQKSEEEDEADQHHAVPAEVWLAEVAEDGEGARREEQTVEAQRAANVDGP